jgi:hypothetical protein
MHAVRLDTRLRSRERDRLAVLRVDGHGRQRDRLLLARGQQHVQFAFRRAGGDFVCQLQQAVRDPGHRGNHGDDLMPRSLRLEQTSRDILDALGTADRGAAVFLDDEHGDAARV